MSSTDKNNPTLLQKLIPSSFFDLIREERIFLGIIALAFFVAGATFENAQVAMWVGFALAGYSAIANDSIQTIGTFLASNMHRKWWYLWLYMGGIFLITVSFSWYTYGGDVSYERLTTKGFDQAPTEFTFLQVAAPIFLLILTRMRMPVSTTFLLLSSFSTSSGAITSVLGKSLSGYFLAFIVAIIVWISLARLFRKFFTGKAHPIWVVLQWITSGALWAAWLMQDAANIAVYLPRSLSFGEFLGFALYIFFGLGLLFYLKGDRIQKIVNEKSMVTEIRSATIIDFVYALILYYFKFQSAIPMSTTWVFIGLLGGRELARSITDGNGKGDQSGQSFKTAFRLIIKDSGYALIGLIVSIILAASINQEIADDIMKLFSY